MLSRISRRAATASAIALVAIASATTSTALAAGVPVPATGLYMGASVQDGPTIEAGIAALDSKTGVRHVISRSYYQWDTLVKNGKLHNDVTAALAAGRTPSISVKGAVNGTMIKFAAIANGSRDADIRIMANALKATNRPIMFSFTHEPEDYIKSGVGTTAEYQGAWRRIVTVFREQGASNVSFSMILTGMAFDNGTAESYYAGDDYIDWIGTDPYAFNGCKNPQNAGDMKSFATIVKTSLDFAKKHNKPLIVQEYGVHALTAADRAKQVQWYAAARASIKTMPELKGLVLFNWDNHGNAGCYWRVDLDAGVTAAYRAMGTDSYFTKDPIKQTPPPPPPTPVDSTKPTVSISSPANGAVISGATTVAVNASDNIGVASVTLTANGVAVGTDTSAPYTFTYNPGSVLGSHTLVATARDAAGNSSAATSIVTLADTIAPTLSVTAPTSKIPANRNVTISANASDNVGVASVQLRINDKWVAGDVTAAYSFSVAYSAFKTGANTVTLIARDAAGNATTKSVTVTR